jgi:hypothetical protein
MLFAHLKRILRVDRLRLRGPNGARDEFHLAAAAQNRQARQAHPEAGPAGARLTATRAGGASAERSTSLNSRLFQQHRPVSAIRFAPHRDFRSAFSPSKTDVPLLLSSAWHSDDLRLRPPMYRYLLNNAIGNPNQRGWERDTKMSGGSQIEEKLEFSDLLHGQIG